MSYKPSRAATFLTGLSTLLLVLSIAFAAFMLVGAIVGFGPNGDEVGIHTSVETSKLADLPPGAIAPDHVDVIIRIPEGTKEQIRWIAARDLAPGAVFVAAL